MNYSQAREKLKAIGQEHLLSYYDELSEVEKEALLLQIETTDFSVIDTLGADHALDKGKITPLAAMEIPEIENKREAFMQLGLEAIRRDKVGAVLLAGGMGTRLGLDLPKGVYNIGLTKELYIFECLMKNLMDVTNKAEHYIHLFVMTSDKNHEETVAFFQEHDYFGYPSAYIHFFKQQMAPAVDRKGKVFLEEKGKISTSPNGNGGWFVSMQASGISDLLHELDIQWLNVFAVDNVLQRIADPVFIGACIETGVNVGAKVVKKANPDEKVGVMCLEDGKPSIVEYYELTDAMRNQRDEKGDYAYNFGVILNYLFRVSTLEETVNNELKLHQVEKKIPYLDAAGNTVKPEEPNGIKFEQLVLDMIHNMDSCLPFEVVRDYEFAPIKNKEGVDSVESARLLLAKNGVTL